MLNYQSILNEIFEEVNKLEPVGEVADYIPELSEVDPSVFGMSLHTVSGDSFHIGQANQAFSIQSIAKVFALTMAYRELGGKLWKRVGVEPSGDPFNSLVQLEYENGIPRNPFINAGALVVCDVLFDILSKPKEDFLSFVREISQNQSIQYSQTVAESEKDYGYKNAAVINLMKSYGNIKHDIDALLDFYFHLCSIEMSCAELSKTFLLFANSGSLLDASSKVLSSSMTKRINAIMQTCGFYDEAGEFSFQVGLPGKSGVGGGIVAIHPGQYAVAVWSPRLNSKGNSAAGMKALEMLTTKSGLSIF